MCYPFQNFSIFSLSSTSKFLGICYCSTPLLGSKICSSPHGLPSQDTYCNTLNITVLFSHSSGDKRPRSKLQPACSLVRAVFMACRHLRERHRARDRDAVLSLLIRALIPLGQGVSLNYFIKGPISKYSQTRAKCQDKDSGGDTQHTAGM